MGLRPTQCPLPRPRLQGPGLSGPPLAKALLATQGPARLRHVEGPSALLATTAL